MSGSIQASFTQERDTLVKNDEKPLNQTNVEYDSNSDISDLVGQLNTQMGSLHYKRTICQAVGFCFLFTILLLSASFFITGMSVFFLVDFGNIVQGPYVGQLVEQLCYPKGDQTFCRGRVLVYQNEHTYLSVDEYPKDSNVWPPYSTEISVYLNKKETELALLPLIRYNPIGIVISSASIFGFVLLLVLTIIGIAFSFIASRKKKKVKYYERSSSSWIKSKSERAKTETSNTTAATEATENQPILEVTTHQKYDQ